MRKIILMLAVITPLSAFADGFLYETYIEKEIRHAEDELHFPPCRASGEQDIETYEQRHWYWSGYWHALRQAEYRRYQFDSTLAPYLR